MYKNEAVTKHKNSITAFLFIEIPLNCNATYCKKVKAIYTANNAENSSYTDKVLIIS